MDSALRKRTNTRARLLEAAERIGVKTGNTRPSIDEIARAAGFTRGAFYSNFASMDELLFALYESKTERLLNSVHQGVSPEEAPHGLTGESEAVQRLLALIPADPHWFALRAALALQAEHDPAIRASLHEHAEELRRGLTPYVEAMVAPERLADPAQGTRVVIAAHVGAVLQGALVDEPERLRADAVLAAVRGLERA